MPQALLPDSDSHEDFTWLFRNASVFDLPAEDYLQLDFGDILGTTPPPPQVSSPVPEDSRDNALGPSEYQKLVIECPEVLVSALSNHSTVTQVLKLAVDYCDVYLPFFHRPTLNLGSSPPLLILSLCGLGMFLSGWPSAKQTGSMLQKHVWRRSAEMAFSSPRVELWLLQAMILFGHISTYALSRHEHEMAEISHGVVVTLARRNDLLAASFRSDSAPRQSLDERWREWAQRESVIRLAHTIFMDDVQSTIYFTHLATVSVGMMKLPLPSCPSLWQAPTAALWEAQMQQTKRSNRSKYYSVHKSVEALSSIRDPEMKREFLQRFGSSNPLALNILIHGVASAIGDDKYRTISTSSSLATRLLKVSDFGEALAHWKECFDRLPETDQNSPTSWVSILMYHFAAVLLRNNISDVQMAAGSAFSFGRTVTPQRAQEAYARLIGAEPVSQETYLHGLEIVRLCLQRPEASPVAHDSAPPPLWQTYCAFLGTLVIWAYTVGLENSGKEKIKLVNAALRPLPQTLGVVDLEMATDDRAGKVLAVMFERVLDQPEVGLRELQAIRNDLGVLIDVVHGRLEASTWDISSEARRILRSLKEREESSPPQR
ncbi:hypothetical protein H2200_000510 [Cladophialophora chaetospira]|uniref:Xylanolytic transcriptional activator regulatory domain-containing protein n=1 Tax=Cladophialophora chaetospira TaxID=386627 RepID=A0AA38XPE2_9EURO|nr:hypothetical protein H2200_000510 [Cladophialophora chaetospira]